MHAESLGHEHDTASCHAAARQLLNGHPYSYALLDLEIPVRPDRGFARIENAVRRRFRAQRGRRKQNLRVKSNATYWLHENAETIIRFRAWIKAGRAEELFQQITYVTPELAV